MLSKRRYIKRLKNRKVIISQLNFTTIEFQTFDFSISSKEMKIVIIVFYLPSKFVQRSIACVFDIL